MTNNEKLIWATVFGAELATQRQNCRNPILITDDHFIRDAAHKATVALDTLKEESARFKKENYTHENPIVAFFRGEDEN